MPFYESFTIHFRPDLLGPYQDLRIHAAPINVFVGPNGAGKSTIVNELSASQHQVPMMAHDRTLDAPLMMAEFVPTLSKLYGLRATVDDFLTDARIRTLDCRNHPNESQVEFKPQLRSFEAERRLVLSVSRSANEIQRGSRASFTAHPISRLDVLFRDPARFQTFRTQLVELTGLFPVIDAVGGNLQLRLSRIRPPDAIGQMITAENEAFMAATIGLDKLSDGTRTYLGLWGHLYSGDERLIFLDEAGAFLHPPLARKLGKQLSQLAVERDGHVFAATHSPDFVLGCVQAGCRANVIRLTYRNGVSTARLLTSSDLEPLMRDPLLRSANVLSGLFHDGVVVCEADADRAFYQELNERLISIGEGTDSCHFVNAQNWQTIPRIAAALRRLGVPAAMIVDIDAVVHDNTKTLLEAAGIPDPVLKSLGQLRGDLTKRIEDRDALKWDGLAYVKDGVTRDSWDKYLRDLADYGIFVVPVGELEGWFPELGVPRPKKKNKESKGPWIIEIFARMGSDPTDASYVRPTADGPWHLLRAVARWILDPQRRGIPPVATTIACCNPPA